MRDDELGELICKRCGMVISSTEFSTGPEWRAFNPAQREKLPRVGAPLTWTMHDKGLSTIIGWRGRDYAGRSLDKEERARLYRLRKWHRRSKFDDSMDRNLNNALQEIKNISYDLNLPRNVIETSSVIYRGALKGNLIRGRTIKSMAAACIYTACRQCGVIRTLSDVANASSIQKKMLARTYRFLVQRLDKNVPRTSQLQYIGKLVNALRLDGDTEKFASLILKQASELKLTVGRGPSGMAAACIYISTVICRTQRTQGEIAEAAQVTEVTIRNRYKELVEKLDLYIEL